MGLLCFPEQQQCAQHLQGSHESSVCVFVLGTMGVIGKIFVQLWWVICR